MSNTTTNVTVTWAPGHVAMLAGLPLDANGNIANNSSAAGILQHDLFRPLTTATIITAGQWDEEIGRAHCGLALSDACKRALKNIKFTNAEGVQQYVTTNPIPTEGKSPKGNGNVYESDVPFSGSYEDLTHKPLIEHFEHVSGETVPVETFNDLLDALEAAGLMAAAE